MLTKIINILKIIILAILNFISSLFTNTNKKNNETQKYKKKTNTSKVINNPKDNIVIPDETISNKDFTTPSIDYDKLFKQIIKDEYSSLDQNIKNVIKKKKKDIIKKVKEKKITNTNKIKDELKEIIQKEINLEKNNNIETKINQTEEKIIQENKQEQDKNNESIIKIETPNIDNKEIKEEQKKNTPTNTNSKENKPKINNTSIQDTESIHNTNVIDKVIKIEEVKVEYKNNTKEDDIKNISTSYINEPNNTIDNHIEEKTQKDDKKIPEKKQETKTKKDLSEYINKLNIITKNVIKDINNELENKELNEDNYQKLNQYTIDTLNKLQEFININELTEEELRNIKNNIKELELTKIKINNHKANEIEKYNNELDQNISDEEKNNVNELLLEMQNDYKKDLLDLNINSIDDLNYKTEEEIKEIEKKLISIKLNKALKCAELPSIIALPFIKNKFFAFFTAGLFVHNHISDLIFFNHRKDRNINTINMDNIIKGTNALDHSISITEENLNNLENLKLEYLNKYPELINNIEFINSFNRLENKLISNYNILLNQKNRFNKTKNKANKINKKINQKKLLKIKRV